VRSKRPGKCSRGEERSLFKPLLPVLLSLIHPSVIIYILYADDTQLIISFVTSELSTNIVHLQATIDLVFQWMSSNFLLINQSKSEFLVISKPAQLVKISNPSLPMP